MSKVREAPLLITHGTISGYTYHGCRCDDCRATQREKMRQWRAANPEKARAAGERSRKALRDRDPSYHARYKLDRKRRLTAEWKARLGGACVKCSTTERLEFDHIDPASKLEEPYKVLMQWPEERIASELSKCQLLCRRCHRKKSHEDWGHNVEW